MKIALVAPPYGEIYGSFRKTLKYGFLNPPLSLGYLASSLESKGHTVDMIDAETMMLTNKSLSEILTRERYGLIGITATTPDFHKALELAKLIKERSDIHIVLGGMHATIFRKDILAENIYFDSLVVGEGENTICELADSIENKKDLKNIKSLIFRKGDEIAENELRQVEENIDKFPFPSRNMMKNELYLRSIPKKGYVRTTAFMSSRGCPYKCIYCAIEKIPGSKKIRYRSPENIVEELDIIINKFGIKHISFNDDVLTLNKERMYEICRLIKKNGLKFTWEGLGRADNIDRELLLAMKDAGFIRISYGIESGNEDILKMVQKGETLEEIRKAYEITKSTGIVARGSMIIGLPYETRKTVLNSFKFINSLKGLDQVIINIASPYPGTKLRDMVLDGTGGTKLLTKGLSDLRRFDNAVISVNDLEPNDLIKLQKKGLLGFYLRPHIVIRNLQINHWRSFFIDSTLFIRSIFGI